jgi:2-polyprenyl-6-hydroxyphenyl methylase/3-demethylubiquinone-9 3-methyltransferase
MSGYYAKKLAAERLELVYTIASPRIRQYLDAEIDHVVGQIRSHDIILELGCGYGRVLERLTTNVGVAIGVDTSIESLSYGRARGILPANCFLICADAVHLPFTDGLFDCTLCIQNGISAFKVDRLALLRESVRVTRSGGKVLYSSYAARFWPDRLEWFEAQSRAGLLGSIDYDKTSEGVIVCTDGFTANTVGPEEFRSLAAQIGVKPVIQEVDGSSLFCEITKE